MSIALKRYESKAELQIDGHPFLILGGEVRNSSASSLEFMEMNVWPSIRGLYLNTLLVPVYWELIEQAPGEFDFSLPDGLIAQAEREGVKLIFLWFGLWKNGESTYVPTWLWKEPCFRMRTRNGNPVNSISPLCFDSVQRDGDAFCALMRHLRETDVHQTVIMAQVENEVGLLGDVRDFSEPAKEAYNLQIPEELGNLYGRDGTWHDVLGEDAPETFMAWHFARAVGQIAQRGKKEYNLPMYTNCWLEQYPWTPGTYPSGGPTAKMMPVWKLAAPELDFISPDIYLPDFDSVCNQYCECGNTIFVPEARPSVDSASNVFCLFGKYHGLGFSSFAIEDVGRETAPPAASDLKALNISQDAFDHTNAGYFLAKSYGLLRKMLPIIAEYRGKFSMKGFVQENDPGEVIQFEKYDFRITFQDRQAGHPKGGGMIIQFHEDEFVLVGLNFLAYPLIKRDATDYCEFLLIEECSIDMESGTCIAGRRLNGDERSLKFGGIPEMLRVRLKTTQS